MSKYYHLFLVLLVTHPLISSVFEPFEKELENLQTFDEEEQYKKLLNKIPDLDVNKPDSKGIPPLVYAAATGQKGIIRALLTSKKLNIDLPDSDGYTALHYASQHKLSAITQELIAHGAEVNVAITKGDNKGKTALDLGIEPDKGAALFAEATKEIPHRIEVLKQLIEHNGIAKKTHLSPQDKSELAQDAINNDDLKLLTFIVKDDPAFKLPTIPPTSKLLEQANAQNNPVIAQKLVEAGALQNVSKKGGETNLKKLVEALEQLAVMPRQ